MIVRYAQAGMWCISMARGLSCWTVMTISMFVPRLESSAVEQSSVACGALISSFFECLRYALSHGKIQQADTSYNVEKSLLCDHVGPHYYCSILSNSCWVS